MSTASLVDLVSPYSKSPLRPQKGTITFSSDYPKGLIFPGYDDEKHRARKCDFSGMPELRPVEGDYSDLRDENEFDGDDDDEEGK
jgi:hypothetical protein